MSLTKQSKKEFIYNAKLYIENASSDDYVKERILTIGYDEKRLAEGLLQQAKADESMQRQIAASDKSKSLHTATRNLHTARSRTYMGDVRLFKSTFIRDIPVKERLGLYGTTRRDTPGFIQQATRLYNTLSNEPAALSRLEKFKITAETLKERLDGIGELEKAYKAFVEASKEAQDATDESDKDYGILIDWVREFQDACRMVLIERTQLQEKVGILVRSSKPPKKKKDEPGTGTGTGTGSGNGTGSGSGSKKISGPEGVG